MLVVRLGDLGVGERWRIVLAHNLRLFALDWLLPAEEAEHVRFRPRWYPCQGSTMRRHLGALLAPLNRELADMVGAVRMPATLT